MPNQSADRVLAAFKREAVFGTPEATGAGATQMRLLDSQGLKFTRGEVPSEERRTDKLEQLTALGGHDVNGSYISEITPGAGLDPLIESLVRGTLGAPLSVATVSGATKVALVQPAAVPIDTSFTIEQQDLDADESELFFGVRVVQADFSFQPRQRAKVTYTLKGLSRNLINAAAAPYFTPVTLPSGVSLIVDSANILYKGAAITTVSGLDISCVVENSSQDVVGNLVGIDVFTNTLRVSGTISVVRENHLALTDFDNETQFEIQIVLVEPGTGAKLTFAINLPVVLITDIDAPFLGGVGAKIETRTFKAFALAGTQSAIKFYTSTGTPVVFV